MTEEKAPKIYEAIATIMKKTKAIAKGQRNEQQGFMYRGIDSIMNELHDVFADSGVFILPEVLDYQVTEKVSGRGTILYYTRAKIRFHFTAEDGSEVYTINVGEAMDSGDKGMNKAMSIALKYALMQMLLIPTKEDKDPDAVTPPETRPRTIAEIAKALDPVKDVELQQALTAIVEANTKEELVNVWKAYSPKLQQNPTFTQCMSTRKKEIGL
jgi:hypothetical protein